MEVNSVPPPPPYWTQPATAMPRRRSSSSPLVSPPLLIILLPILTFIFLFFAIPPFLSLTSQIFRPITVKRSWDWLNLFLVLFAILFGIFARRNDDESIAEEEINNVDTNAVDNVSDYVNLTSVVAESELVSLNRTPGTAGLRLRRSSSSYPDLRQESMWENGDDPQRFHFRFFDDFDINKYRTVPNSFDHDPQPRRRSLNDDSKIKVIPVDTFDLRPSTPPKSPAPPPPPPPPPPSAHHKPRRTYRTVGRKENVPEKIDNNIVNEEFARVRSPPQAPPPPPPRPPPPPPSPARIRSDQKQGKLERRKSNVKKEITMAFSSLYNQRKRKKKQKITNPNFDSATVSPTEQSSHYTTSHYTKIPPPSPPPPPPPPPPPSVFHNLFKKGSKSKKIHSVPAPPPPPPPPISSSSRSSKHKTRSIPPSPPPPPPERSRWKPSSSSGRPPLPTKSSFYEENPINSGCQSPMNIPVPPPPPPFRMPEVKFFFRGDFVRIRSAQSSRCGSPEPEDADRSPVKVGQSEKVNVMDGGDGICAVTCPSPDVNIKADTFIARLHDGWRREKINSIREKEEI